MLLYNALGELRSSLPDDIHPARLEGRDAGQKNAGNWEMFTSVVDGALGCVVDRKAHDDDRRRSGEYLLGFCESWGEAMAVKPLRFLTRYETIRVQALPDWLRAKWLAAYHAGVTAWIAQGGASSGKGPQLPQIPDTNRRDHR